MIVAPKFDGDNNDDLMLAQHDVYWEALRIIISECLHVRRCVREFMKEYDEDPLLGDYTQISYDHRDFQNAHDWLAAYWRIFSGYTQPQFDFDNNAKLAQDWLIWLQNEARGWFRREPSIVRTVIAVIATKGTNASKVCIGELYHKITQLYPLDITE